VGERVDIADVRPGEDDEFLLAVYASTRGRDLDLLGLSGDEARAFLRMQYDAQDRHFAAAHPDARRGLVLVDATPVGRLVVDRAEAIWWIVDLALLPAWRGRGVGGTVVGRFVDDADAAGVAVRCHVAVDNPARRFWARFGFEPRRDDGAYLALERVCGTSAR
jgi:ribosomal protein S18 acetylase RimI-like enzyme